ncbi:MAG TPA: B12-binding domain-containing protein [Gaiellaceae bacterium]|jgi:DNA-binding transcriptional MerR regulator|nr:B12-binding domain-containing protein [Gaiellaceae bacterium]
MDDAVQLRIGALSRLVGVSPELLRAWEQRYGLLQPSRSAGGFRLYSNADEARVLAMQRHLETGLPAAEAARLALVETARRGADEASGGLARLGQLSAELRAALDEFDEPGAQTALDRLFAGFRLQTVLRDVVLPYLHELGLRWERGEASVAQEHFASNILRGRLLGLARGWADASGPRALLACAPGELHDLPLIGFGLTLAAHGWSITYLGPDTPIATIEETLRRREQTLVVISAMTAERFSAVQAELTGLARGFRLGLAGAGATSEVTAAVGAALMLADDPVTAAERIADEWR